MISCWGLIACAPATPERSTSNSPDRQRNAKDATTRDASALTIELVLANKRVTRGSKIPVDVRLHNNGHRRVEVPDFSFDDSDNRGIVFGVGNKTTGVHVGQFHVLDILISFGHSVAAEEPQTEGEIEKTVLKARETLTLSFDLALLIGPLAEGTYIVGVFYETFDSELSHELEFEIVAQ